MIDLDEKLEELLENENAGLRAEDIPSYDYPEMVTKIKQAFKDAGYINLSDRGGLIHTTVVDSRGRIEYMTGQEWYDRLLLNIDVNRYHESDPEYAAQKSVLEAAKKAAGIE